MQEDIETSPRPGGWAQAGRSGAHAQDRACGLGWAGMPVWPWVLAGLMAWLAHSLSYGDLLAEPDLVRMMAALVYGSGTGLELRAGQHYGASFSFGYYQLIYALWSPEVLQRPQGAARAINTLGSVGAWLFALGWCFLCRQLLGGAGARVAAAGLLLAPVSLPFLGSAHPMLLAGACLFGATACLVGSGRGGRVRILELAAGLALLVLGLSFRGEIGLAYPFILACVWTRGRAHRARDLAGVALVLVAAWGVYAKLQTPWIETTGGAWASAQAFVESFYALRRIGRGVLLLVLSLGLASLALLLWRWRDARPVGLRLLPGLALALPELAFWLPNPQPARHLVLAVAGLALCAGALWGDRVNRLSSVRLWGLVVGLALVNQIAAELVRPLLVRQQDWAYAAAGARRATPQVPMLGLVWWDHKVLLEAERGMQDEARRIAAARPRQLLVLGDSRYHIVAHLLADDPQLRMHVDEFAGAETVWLTGPGRRIGLISKFSAWPQDTAARLLAQPDPGRTPVYVQASTLSRHDRTDIPPERRWEPGP